jgi:hypothetical protein
MQRSREWTLLPAVGRASHEMPHSCPDPHCKSRMKITRTQKRVFSHSAVTAVPLEQGGPSKEEQDRTRDDVLESLVRNSKRSNTMH